MSFVIQASGSPSINFEFITSLVHDHFNSSLDERMFLRVVVQVLGDL